MPTRIKLWAALIITLSTACTQMPSGEEKRRGPLAQVISSPEQLLWGPVSTGALGDYRIENSQIVAIVGHPSRPVGFSVTGGNLVDLAQKSSNQEDHLNQLTLYLQDEFPRQAIYKSAKIVSEGGPGSPAILRAIGLDSKNDKIAIETDYILLPDADWLTLETRFTSTATYTIPNYKPGDAVQWGRCQHLGPGAGFALPGRRLNLPWLAGLGQKTSYGLVEHEGESMEVLSGSMWSDTISKGQDLAPKQTIKHIRHVVVGSGDTASLMPSIFKLSRQKTGTISGRITSSKQVITDARVEIRNKDEELVGIAKTNLEGWYEIQVLPGEYSLLAMAPGRPRVQTSTTSRSVQITAETTASRSFNLGRRTSLSWRIEGDENYAQAVKLTVLGIDGTPNPNFGPTYRADGAAHIVLSPRGLGEIPLGLGRYKVIVSRGNEYELIEREIEIKPDTPTIIEGKLVRSVDTRGFIATELHQHTAPSFDSGVSLEDRTISLAAEGIEAFTSSDHNVLIDFQPTIAATGLGRSLTSFIGTEATTHSVGHFNAFPLKVDRSDSRGGMKDPEHWTPQEIFSFVRGLAITSTDSVVQINHPRAGYIGYLDMMKFDPKTGKAEDKRFSLDFDAMEIIAFGFEKETKQTLADWFALLRRGIRVTATGNSDSHTVYGRENGWPRNLICSDQDLPYRVEVTELMKSLRDGCSTISAGPIITINAEDARMGGTTKATNGRAQIDIKIQAPKWIPVDWLEIYVDGRKQKRIPIRGEKVVRYEKTHTIKCNKDCFVVAMTGSDKSLAPIVSTWRKRNPKPIALTNPIFLDVDGDGQYMKGGPK